MRFDSLKEIKVYGELGEPEDRLKTPKSFLTVYDNIDKFDNKNAKAWLPDSIEVNLYKLSKLQQRPLIWPKGWPDLKNSTVLNERRNVRRIYIDKKNLTKLIALSKNGRPVEINGQQFVSYTG